jgi:hypothetical protein
MGPAVPRVQAEHRRWSLTLCFLGTVRAVGLVLAVENDTSDCPIRQRAGREDPAGSSSRKIRAFPGGLMEEITSEHTTHRLSPMAITLPFIVGGIAGAAAALLFAPQSGDATRKLVRRKLDETVVSARDLKDRTVRRGQAAKDEATSRVQGAASALAGTGGLTGHEAARAQV